MEALVSERFDRLISNLADKFARLSLEQRQDLEKKLDVDDLEMTTYQNWQSEAHVMNLITSAEAQFLYASLGGENPSVSAWNRLTLPQKIFITQLMGEKRLVRN